MSLAWTASMTAKEWSDNLSRSSYSFREEESKVATSTADVKRCVACLGCRPFDSHSLPDSVLPQAEGVIQLQQECAGSETTHCAERTKQCLVLLSQRLTDLFRLQTD